MQYPWKPVLALLRLSSGLFSADKPIRIAAAANLASLAEPMKVAFAKTAYGNKHPSTALEFSFGASGALAAREVFTAFGYGVP